MILKDYEETCDPFYFIIDLQNDKVFPFSSKSFFNPINRGSKKGLSYDSPRLSVSIGCSSIV